jgi:transcriptional regulator with XRE-family HTH domain
MNYFSKNLRFLREKEGLKQDEFERIGIKKGTLSNYELGKTEPKLDLLLGLSKFFRISIDDLLTINLEESFIGNTFHSNKHLSEINDNVFVYGNNKAVERKIENQIIPIYNIEAAAGLTSLFNDYTSQKPIDYISLPNLGKVDGGLYAFGDSMYPLIKSGDIVVFREIHDMFNNIFWGEMYLLSYDLEGEEYIVIKYIQKSDINGYVKLVSQNQHHSPKDIPIERINALAQVKASVRFNTMRTTF